jgi:hypothetical protein
LLGNALLLWLRLLLRGKIAAASEGSTVAALLRSKRLVAVL